LRIEIARSRNLVARDLRGLRYELDIPRKIRRSFREQTPLWIGAAVVIGTLIVLLPMRKKEVYVDLASGTKGKARRSKLLETGFLLGALRIAMTLAKPTIANFVLKKVRGYTGEPRPAPKW
jgi:hypothetical protein